MNKKPHVRTLTETQHVKGPGTLFKSVRQYFCHIFRSIWKKICLKNFVLVVYEILRLFVNILTPDDKYSLSKISLSKSDCLTQPIQMQLSKNLKTFSQFLATFLEST